MTDDSALPNDPTATPASTGASEWIVIPNWDRYQHYNDRAPKWIKDHLSQFDDDEYIKLTFAERGLLSGLRLAYAASDGRLPKNAASVSQRLRRRVTNRQLNALRDAGFIEVCASRPVSLTRARERALEEKNLEEKNSDRASAQEQEQPPTPRTTNGELEPAGVTVDADMLRLARGWLKDHGADDATTDDDQWF